MAGGALVSLVACIVISQRLTPVPVPWRDIGVSVFISASTGLSASLASSVLGDVPALFRLGAGGIAGGLVFLGLNWVFHPVAAKQFVIKAWARLRPA